MTDSDQALKRPRDKTADLDDASWQKLSDAIAKLESAWKDSTPHNLRPFVPDCDDPVRQLIIVELIKVDQELGLQQGRQRMLESYLEEWPELAADDEAMVQLVTAEYINQANAGQSLNLASLRQRFPQLAGCIDLEWLAAQTSPDHAVVVPQPSSQLREGASFGRYEIREPIGQGSMGAVYRAWDTRLRREVALKIPQLPDRSHQEFTERFRNEAIAMAQVHHSTVCPVFDAFEEQDTLALTMAYVEGDNVDKWLKKASPDELRAAELTRAVARGVDAIHERGVVHRDLKPANILINRQGEPIITDFGLALADGSMSQGSDEPSISGTPAYMSPEQVEGGQIDARSDVYGLGVLLFQLLTKSLPFTGTLREVLKAVKSEPPPKPSRRHPKLDRKLEAVCLKAIEKRPEDRYASAGEMADALEVCVTSLKQRQARRRRRIYSAGGAVVLALVTWLAVWYFRQPPASDERVMLLAKHYARFPIGIGGSGRAALALDDDRLWLGSQEQRCLQLFNVRTRESEIALEFTIPDRFFNDDDDWKAPRRTHRGVVLSKDERYVFATDYYAACVVRIDLHAENPNKSAKFLPVSHRWLDDISITPDGRLLVVGMGRSGRSTESFDDRLAIINIENGEFDLLKEVSLPGQPEGRGFDFDANSQYAFVITRNFDTSTFSLCRIHLAEAIDPAELPFPDAQLHDTAVDTKRGVIYVSDRTSRTIRVVDLETFGDTGVSYEVYGHVPNALVLDRVQDVLVTLCASARKLVCLDPETGDVIGGAHDLHTNPERLLISPSGRYLWTTHPQGKVSHFEMDDLLQRIVYVSDRNGAAQLYVTSSAGDSAVWLSEAPGRCDPIEEATHSERCPRWSPDGKRIAYISNRAGKNHVCIVKRAGDGIQVFDQTDPPMRSSPHATLDWSADGKKIVFIANEYRAVRVLDVSTGEVTTALDGPAVIDETRKYDRHHSLSWARDDGRILLSSQPMAYSGDIDVLLLNPGTGEVEAITNDWGNATAHAYPAASPTEEEYALIRSEGDDKKATYEVRTSNGEVLCESTREQLASLNWIPGRAGVLYSAGTDGDYRVMLKLKGHLEPRSLTSRQSNCLEPAIWSAR